jgi:hypothetical protein
MRAFSACLTVFLGLGAFSVVACSSDASTTAAGGASGETNSAGGGGATGIGGGTSEAGACSFDAPGCGTCLQDKCGTETVTCGSDDTCAGALSALEGCACDASKTIDECKTTFGQNGGDPAAPLVTCYNDNCTTACE